MSSNFNTSNFKFWNISLSVSNIRAYIKETWNLDPEETDNAGEIAHILKTEYWEAINDSVRESMEFFVREAVEKVGFKVKNQNE